MSHTDESFIPPRSAAVIDPIQYGALTAQVTNLEREVQELKADVRALLELANKSKGGLWAGMAIVSAGSALVSWIVAHLPWFK
jgi:hypothetical protein